MKADELKGRFVDLKYNEVIVYTGKIAVVSENVVFLDPHTMDNETEEIMRRSLRMSSNYWVADPS